MNQHSNHKVILNTMLKDFNNTNLPLLINIKHHNEINTKKMSGIFTDKNAWCFLCVAVNEKGFEFQSPLDPLVLAQFFRECLLAIEGNKPIHLITKQ